MIGPVCASQSPWWFGAHVVPIVSSLGGPLLLVVGSGFISNGILSSHGAMGFHRASNIASECHCLCRRHSPQANVHLRHELQ